MFAWLGRILEPSTDFYGMLNRQAAKTLEGLEALDAWIGDGAEERCQTVRDLERQADELKLDLERRLVESFVTPLDREDIYDLSARMDEIINAAKSTVREIEALEISADDLYLREMSQVLVEGTRCVVQSFSWLKGDPKEASNQAFLVRKSENRFTKIYRQAMRQLFMLDDFKKVLRTREVYRSMLACAERIDIVGEKLLHVIVKIS
ncbi:MAG: DUF47 family protein [Candidatus Melainabacteria bacterium]|nr:DUF47 family protein [Candidatus Melainabacteria bacterium]